MNGEIPSVPITTLAGVSSLVDLLPEMPLPSPLPQTLSNKSLLFHPRVAEEAQRLLTMNDDNLIPQLIQSLSMTSSKHIDLKDQYNEMPLDNPNAPRLLAGIILRKPDVFKGKHVAEQMIDWSQTQGQMNPMFGMNNISGMSQQPSQNQHMMPATSTSHMSMNPMDIQAHHTGLMNSDSMHSMMQTSLDFISGLQSEQAAKSDQRIAVQSGAPVMNYNCESDTRSKKLDPHHGLPIPDHSNSTLTMYNSPSNSNRVPNSPGSSPFAHGMSLPGYPPQMNLNHHPQVQQQQQQQPAHQSHTKAQQPTNAMMHHQYPQQSNTQQQQQNPLPLQSMSPNKQSTSTNSHSPYGGNMASPSASNSQSSSSRHPPPQIPQINSIGQEIGASPSHTMVHQSMDSPFHTQVQQTSQYPPNQSSSSSSAVVVNSSASNTHCLGGPNTTSVPNSTQSLNSLANSLPESSLTQMNNNLSATPAPTVPVATISMNVPLVKLETINANTPKKNNASANVNHTPLQPQKELLVKLERSNEITLALQKLEKKDSSVSESDTSVPNNRLSGRKGSNTSKNYREETSEEDEDDDQGSPSKGKKGKIFKTKENVKDKRKKRESREDSEYTGEVVNVESKKRKNSVLASQMEPEVMDESPKKKVRRVERMLIPVLEKLGGNTRNILDNSTYHRFLKTMDIVLETIDYADKSEIDMDEDGNVPSEFLLSKTHLSELCSEAAKLKALGAMEAMPTEKIVRLLTLLEINIRDGCRVTPLADPEDNDDESRLWGELTMESISRGVVAALTALHILTSPNMPKRTYLEDLIDRIVIFSKFQLQNTIFPTFDPVYRIDRRGGKEFSSSNKKKRAHAREVREKAMISFYTKMHEVVVQLAELLNVQVLTDTTVLHLSTLGVSPFFVENVSELQLSALKLVTGIFTHYEKHRRLLLDDILASIARLPSSKRSLRTFKLSAGSDECIQMLTALVLQLIQCVTHLPDKMASNTKPVHAESDAEKQTEKQTNTNRDITISGRFDTALRTAGTFLSVFLGKCGSKSEDCDYRILFENFVQDLLSTVNKPEWPAAELLLSLLGNLLVKNLGNKGLEVSMRVASLEYLGVAAARLRKDAVSAQKKMETIDRIITDIRAEEERFGDVKKDILDLDNEEDKVEFLQRLLLDYLAVNGQSDPALMQSRHFYIASWWKSAQNDIAKSIKQDSSSSKTNRAKKKKKKKATSSGEESEESELSEEEPEDGPESALNTKLLQLVERRRNFLLTKIRPFADPLLTSRKTEVVQTFVDYQSAELITRYLASKRPFSASFDFFLTRILSVSTEQTVAIRTKALRCLTMVVEADPSVLARHDMQLWVRHSFLDQSTAVREAAVDLVGKYVLSCPDLIEKYYDILSLRILDTGVSVRKRVIKILRDVCVEHPNFQKIPEICVKMIRRVNDEDGIRKLVMEVFQNMWFTAVREEPLDTTALLRKVSNITEVVASCEKIGLDFFEQLLLSLFKPKEDKDDVREKVVNQEPPKAVVVASRQIVNCLVEHVLRLEESVDSNNSSTSSSSSQRFIACVATLYLFAKIRPQLLVNHAITLEGYLSLRCQSVAEVQAIANIAAILELVVPLLVNPADSFLAQLEEDCVKLIFKNDKGVIDSCLACLGAVVNKITRNYALVRDVFRRFQSVLFNQTKMVRDDPNDPKLMESRPRLRRSIYTIGLFLRYFDFLHRDVYGDLPSTTVNIIFSELMYLIDQPSVDLQFFSLQAVGNMCIRHYDFMLGDELKRVYQSLLTSSAEIKLRTQALYNIQLYLTEEELRMIKQDQEWNKNAKLQDIKEMGDVTSGMASTIVQIYLKQILEAFLHRDLSVRLAAVRVIQLVLQQGLVHPIQIVPYLICMSTDEEPGVATTADKQLQEMEKKHPQFLQSQVLNGIRLSLQLQRILAGYNGPLTTLVGFQMHNQTIDSLASIIEEDIPVVRGYRVRPKESPSALNGFLYSLLRSTKPQRRAIVLSLLKQFDDQNKNRLADLLYYCDNLAYFPYQVIDEPLFIIHHVDIVISVTGSNLLQSFKESLLPVHNNDNEKLPGEINPVENGDVNPEAPVNQAPIQDDDDDDEDLETMLSRMPEDTKTLEDCITGSQGCLLLLMLKQHLKDTYAITDSRISGYSPSDASKAFERPVNRRNTHIFDPKCTLANLQCPPSGLTPEGRRALIEQYMHFKQLMLRIDPEDADEDGESKPTNSKLKIDQNLFTYAATKPGKQVVPVNDQIVGLPNQNTLSTGNNAGAITMNSAPQYVVVSNPKVEPVKIPKLTIVPLKFPSNDQSPRKAHKVKEKDHHHHHHKHKKSKHKKKKRHAISDDSDSDNSDDPDFRC